MGKVRLFLTELLHFHVFIYKGGNFVASSLLSCTQCPFKKKSGIIQTEKKLAPTGSIFFPFKSRPRFSEGRQKLIELSCLP